MSPPSHMHFSEAHMEFSKEKVVFYRVHAWWKMAIGKIARSKKKLIYPLSFRTD